MRKLMFAFMLIMSIITAQAAIEDGKTYRIVPSADASRSLFVANASLNNKDAVVTWTETDVPAQQWTLKSLSGSNKYTIQNVYTGLYLSANNSKLVQSSSPFYWTLEAHETPTGEKYAMVNLSKYLSVTGSKDGTQPTMASKPTNLNDDACVALWQFVETEAQPEFTAAMRDRMASGFLDHYLKNTGLRMRTFIYGSWGESETMEAVLDMYEQTGESTYWDAYNYCYRYFTQKVGNTWTGGAKDGSYHWYGYDFNDDVMWHIIGAARAAKLTGNQDYLNDAKRNFDAIYSRANLGYVQLMRWAEHTGDRNGTNSCINGPTEVAACYIGIVSADESYFEKARTLYANQRQYLFDANTGHVYDAVVLNPDTKAVVSSNHWASTYNQGTMLGAACLLYQHYQDPIYKQDAERIMHYAMEHLCNEHGIISVCQNADGDFQGFKGILMRYAGLYARTFHDEEVNQWLIRNAFHAYNNMNSRHYGHSAWLTKAGEDDFYGTVNYGTQAFGASTSLSAAFSATIVPKEDAIEAPESACRTAPSGVYTMDGRKVMGAIPSGQYASKLKPGLYVINGKKVLK